MTGTGPSDVQREDGQEHPLREPVLTELAACYGTDDWPWLSDLVDVVVGLIEQHAQAVIDARWAAVFGRQLQSADEGES